MKEYESIIIINDNLTEEEKQQNIKNIEEFINKNGKLNKTKILGSKKLAYEIKGNKTGYYCIFYIKVEPSIMLELERMYRINEEIMKFMNVRVEE